MFEFGQVVLEKKKSRVRQFRLGYFLYDIWNKKPKTNCLDFFPVIKERLIDISVHSCQEQFNNS